MVAPLRTIHVSEWISIGRSLDTVYLALADISTLAARNPLVQSSEALAGSRWRWTVRQPGGGIAVQTVRLVEAHRPDRLIIASHIGPSRLVTDYRICDHEGYTRVRAKMSWVLPYAWAILGGRWAGYQRYLTAQLHSGLVNLHQQLEVTTNPAP